MAKVGPIETKLFLKQAKTLHKSFKSILITANCFGVLPVYGVASNSVEDLSFRWISLKNLFSFLLLFQALCASLLYLICLFKEGLSSSLLTGFCIFFVWFLGIVAYFDLAIKWPLFMKKWQEVDLSMQRVYNYPSSLDVRFKIAITLAFVGAAVVHIIVVLCTGNQLVLDAVKSFTTIIGTRYIHIGFLKCLIQINFIIAIFTWIFNDVFIILISTALALRFKQITDRVLNCGRNMQSLEFWSEIRTDYIRLFKLCQVTNECVSFQISLSFACNILCLLQDLFLIIKYNNTELSNETFLNYIDVVWCSLTIIFTSLYSAWVNDESKRFADALNNIPPENYNLAIELLVEQIPFNPVALSGNNIFRCTRGLILNIVGAAITYELLLIQFSEAIVSR